MNIGETTKHRISEVIAQNVVISDSGSYNLANDVSRDVQDILFKELWDKTFINTYLIRNESRENNWR